MTATALPAGLGTAVRGAVRLPARAWMDIAVLTALTLLAILGFAPTFTSTSYLVAGAGGLIVGTAAAVLAATFRLGILTSAAVAVLAYLIFGSALAMPAVATAVVLPSADTLSGLLIGAVYGWADVVTLTTPVGAPDYIGVLPYLCGWAVGLISATIGGRWYATRRRGAISSALGLLAPTSIYVLSVLTGTAQPYLPAIRGIAFAVLALVWLTWRVPENANASKAARTATMRRRLAGVAVVVTIAIIGGATIGTLAAPPADQRFVLRDEVQPPFDPLEYPSPLSAFRHYTKDLKNDVLFTVSGVVGGEDIRIATMDTYTGKLWTVSGGDPRFDGSGTFALVDGQSLPSVPLAASGDTVTMTVSIGAYQDVWMPSVGYPKSVTFDAASEPSATALRYNDVTGVIVDTETLKRDDSYTLVATEPVIDKAALADRAVAQLDLPIPVDVPDLVSSQAHAWSDQFDTDYKKLAEIETRLSVDGFLSHGSAAGDSKSLAGHGADRMIDLLGAKYMVGDGEQYASAFALMARSLHIPARVVIGFTVPEGVSGPVDVHGADVSAWVEVAFDKVGWVPFHPTASDTKVPQDQVSKPTTDPQPQVRQPPLNTTGQDDLVSPVEIDDKKKDTPFTIPAWVGTVATAVLVPLGLYFIPVLILGTLKRRRRDRRRAAATSDRRAAGAWDELVDIYSELGYQAPRKVTRVQQALLFEQQFRDEVEARRREQTDVAVRAAGKLARSEQAAEAKRLKATGDANAQPAGARFGSLLEATVVRAREASTWRPGVTSEADPLPVLPGLRDLAVNADASVFSGGDVPSDEIDRLWSESESAAKAARRSVSWFRRQLSKFRIRLPRDIVAIAAGKLAAAARRAPIPKPRKAAVTTG